MKNILKKNIGLVYYFLGIKNKFSNEIKLSVLKKKKRFTKGLIELSKFKLYYVDSASLTNQYTEIVNNNIYAFSKNTDPKYIIDCGANIGLSTLYFNNNYPNSEIIAFEPSPAVFDILKKNTVGLKNIKCIQSAIWNKEGLIRLNSINSDASSITQNINDSTNVEVKTERLKKYLNKQVDFLKIDIEGAEYEVLIDIKDELKQVKNIFIEYHCSDLTNRKLNHIMEILTESDFKYYIKPESAPTSPFENKNKKKNGSYYYQINIFGFKK
jgi:FkbM family methyltransferase